MRFRILVGVAASYMYMCMISQPTCVCMPALLALLCVLRPWLIKLVSSVI